MSEPLQSIAVIGASLSGLRAVEALRVEGFTGEITLVGDEESLPYDRPPLSKQVLAGEWDVEKVSLTSAEALAELDVTLRLGDSAVAFDVDALTVTLESGSELDVDGVVIATGATPRLLDTTLDGVHALRTLADAGKIKRVLDTPGSRLVVVGCGFIGAEVAATAKKRGVDVTLLEMMDLPFEAVLGTEVASVLADIHREQGVDLRCGVGCASILGDGVVEAVELTDGSTIEADVVVVGIGVVPNTDWLASSGLTIDNGVVCDETLSAAPGVVAVGDVARWPHGRYGEMNRIEHWDNAMASAQHAAKRLLHGKEAGAFDPVPWFWTDQYDRKIQLAGRTSGFDQFQIVDGDVESRKFAGLYGRDGQVVAVVAMNRPRHVMKYRRLLEDGISWDDALALEA